MKNVFMKVVMHGPTFHDEQ